jgi:uncharacterized protein YhhL (DUF1145 family)
VIRVGKLLVALVWIGSALALALAEGPWASLGRTLLLVMAAVHALEALAFLPRLRAAGGSLAGHVVQTLLFGFLHVGTLPRPRASG